MYVQASKRQPGASGRLHRKETGEWVWSSEDESESAGGRDDSSGESDSERKPMNTLASAGSSASEDNADSDAEGISEAPPVNLVLRMR